MSHIRIKTTFKQPSDAWGSSEEITMYCHHNLSTDFVTFHYEDGSLVEMSFQDWSPGNDKWDAVERLNFPFKDEWNSELKEGVEYTRFPWESELIFRTPKSKVPEDLSKSVTEDTCKKLGI